MTDTRLVATVYKVLTAEDWQAAQASGVIHTAVDRADGFVHLSTAAQLPLTLARYFSHAKQVMLIAVDSKVLAEKLRFETAVGSDRAGHFPHYYGVLSVEYVDQVWTLERSAFPLPEQLLLEIERIASP